MEIVTSPFYITNTQLGKLALLRETFDPVVRNKYSGKEGKCSSFGDEIGSPEHCFSIYEVKETNFSSLISLLYLADTLDQEIEFRVLTQPLDPEGLTFKCDRFDFCNGPKLPFVLDPNDGRSTIEGKYPLRVATNLIASQPIIKLLVPSPEGIWIYYSVVPTSRRSYYTSRMGSYMEGWMYSNGSFRGQPFSEFCVAKLGGTEI